jgi:hypothetical protein
MDSDSESLAKAICAKKPATTDSDHRFNIAPNLLDQDVTADGAIFQHINGFYNPRRRHLSLGGKSPLAFERKAAQMSWETGT